MIQLIGQHFVSDLIKMPGIYNKKNLGNYRVLQAQKYFLSGCVQNVVHVISSGNVLLMCDVCPSYCTIPVYNTCPIPFNHNLSLNHALAINKTYIFSLFFVELLQFLTQQLSGIFKIFSKLNKQCKMLSLL